MTEPRIDHKGKVFTVRSEKRDFRAVMATEQHLITGSVYLRAGERLKDVLNTGEPFIAVTDAQVFDPSGQHLQYATDFLTVNTTHIAWMMPHDEITRQATTEPTHDAG
ncbi:MAG: hypothetical protein E6J26_03330 [Chloroflexi bacterium]|nr:MAG: hypothetical protein E6J26_03330 [Chloroflexota bacterium]